MEFSRFGFWLFFFLILSACKELPFTDKDIQNNLSSASKAGSPNTDELLSNEASSINQNLKDNPDLEKQVEIEQELSEEEITVISHNMELTEDTVIQNKRVILDMVEIKTFEHDLFILANEFISNHSTIQNFEEGSPAGRNENGKNGGNIKVESKTAKGNLKLILNGEHGGFVPARNRSKSEKSNLRGNDGKNGYNAVYRKVCEDIHLPFVFGLLGRIPIGKNCWYVCSVNPTRGEDGENGRRGLRGYDGKNGGDSGSFLLQAVDLSEFQLTEVKKNPGIGSSGGEGSRGGSGGDAGRNGKDSNKLCKYNLSSPKDGKKGKKGQSGYDGNSGAEGSVCLEQILKDSNSTKESVVCY